MELAQSIGIILAFVGALNWGLVGIAKFDLVAFIGGGQNLGTQMCLPVPSMS